jgi:predicted lipid-binding transport protein (Tim44 family)
MEELIQRVAAAAGIAPDKAQTAIGMILAFLKKDGPTEEMDVLLAELPGASEAAANAAAPSGSGGFFGSLMGALGNSGGIMGLAGQLTGLGLSMDEIQATGKEVFVFAQEKLGREKVEQIAAAIPGLSQLLACK